MREFRGELTGIGSSPAASVAAAGRVVRYVNDYEAVVISPRGRRLLERSSVPLHTASGPVQLRLRAARGRFSSVRSPAGLSIGGRLSGGVEVGGVHVVLAGDDGRGRIDATNGVFYPRILTDADAAVTPTAAGADFSAVLRSRRSPQVLRYRVVLRRGEVLKPLDGGAIVERGLRPVVVIQPPSAVDAQGTAVPVSMDVAGHSLVLSVKHRRLDVAYPILVDPQFTIPSGSPGWSFSNDLYTFWLRRAGGRAIRRAGAAPRLVRAHWAYSSEWCAFADPQPGEVVAPAGSFDSGYCQGAAGGLSGTWTWSATTAGYGEMTDVELDDISYTYDPSNTSPPGWQIAPNGAASTCSEQDGPDSATGVPASISFQGSDCGNQLSIGLGGSPVATGVATLDVGSVLVTAPYLPPTPPAMPGPSMTYGGGPGDADPNWHTCNSGTDPVNCATGDLYNSRTDLSLGGRGLPFALTRTYDAQSAATQQAPGVFGYGWASSFTDRLYFSSEQIWLCTSSCSDYAGGNPGGLPPTQPTVIDSGPGWTVYQEPNDDVYEVISLATVVQANGSEIPFFNGGSTYPAVGSYVQATLTGNSDGTYTYRLPDQETEQFGSTGQLLSEADRYGNTLTMAYDGSGNLSSISDATGRSITLLHNSDGTVSSASGPMGTVRYGYDSNGNLTSVSDLDSGEWQYGYDSSHRLVSETDPLGHTITTTYNAANEVVSQTDAMGRTWSWTYPEDVPQSDPTASSELPAASETVITNPAGDEIDEQFQNGLPTIVTTGYGTSAPSTKMMGYDNNLDLAEVTDANGNTWSYGYDSAGNRVYQRDPVGNITTWVFDSTHDVTSMTDPRGFTTSYAYNGNGELTSMSRSLDSDYGQTSQSTSYGYDTQGDVTSMTDADGKTWHYGYDASGDRSSNTAPGGEETTWTYDQSGYLTSTVSPAGNVSGSNAANYTTTYVNDAYGRPTQITDPLGHQTQISYDLAGNQTSTTDPDANTTTYGYDADNELTTVTRADKTTLTNAYDSDGRLTGQTNGAGKTTSYTYDTLGRVASTTDPLGRTTTYGYDPAGNLTSQTDPQGRTTTYGYDPAGERTSVSYSDGQTADASYTYNGDGQLSSMSDGTGSTTYAYDSLGRLTSQTNGAGQQVSYGYDLDNHETSITYPNGHTVSRAYNSDGQLQSVTDWLGNKTSFGYDPDSNLTSTTFPSSTGEVDASTYNEADQLTGTSINQNASTLASFGYTRDANGQLQSLTPTGVSQSNESYDYTPLNQLASVNGQNYGYDAADNLTQTPSGATLSYDAANELTGLSQGGLNASFTYDQQGERTQSNIPGFASVSYSYDQAQQLDQVTPSGVSATLAGGGGFTLALGQDGQVSAVGGNAYGQLGDGTKNDSASPVQVSNLSDVDAIAAGLRYSVALKSDGTVWAWGYNTHGELGNGATTSSTTPVQVTGLTGITAIAAAMGGSHTLAVKSNGNVWAWGDNTYGDLGNGTTTDDSSPVQVSGLTGITAVAAGENHSLALKSDGTVWAWGANHCGQLGNNTTSPSTTPVPVSGLTRIIAIAAGACDSLALKSDGTVWAWGDNSYGELGNGTTTNSPVPMQVTGLNGITAIAAGDDHNIALQNNGTTWTWGNNSNGQLGNATNTNSPTPVQVSEPSNIAAIGAGADDTLLTTSAGTPYAIGYNGNGQLGNGTWSDSSTPVQISGLAAIRALAPTTYTYDGNGLRATATTAGTTQSYAWDQSGNTPLLLTDGSTSYIYDDNGLPIEQIANDGTVLYYHHDQLGSTRLLTTSTGTVAATYTYDAAGNLASQTGGADTPLRWAGQYQDPSTGLYYLRARYYDPTTSQFLTTDPLDGQTREPYGYAQDDPVNAADPSGLCTLNPSGWLDDINPFSSSNCAYQGTKAAVDALGVSPTDISSVTGVLAMVAAAVPGGEEAAPVFAAISAVTGAMATGEDAGNGDWLQATLDSVASVAGAEGVAERLLSNLSLDKAFETAFEGKDIDEIMNNWEDRKQLAELLDRLGYGSLAAAILNTAGNSADTPVRVC